jgi:hypothetical protein
MVVAVNIAAAHTGGPISKKAIRGEARQVGISFKNEAMDEAVEVAVSRGFLVHARGYNGAAAVTFVKPIPPSYVQPSAPTGPAATGPARSADRERKSWSESHRPH